MRRLATALVLAAALALPAGGEALKGQALTVTLAQAPAVARQALLAGQPEIAARLARGVVAQQPGNLVALLVLSAAEGMLGHPAAAEKTARQAWRLAKTPAERFEAAMLIANALNARKATVRAGFWTRRAAQIAPDEARRNRAIAGLRAIRRMTPWRSRLRFGLTPSSNINNGSKSDTMVIDGLPFALSGGAQALSGLEISYGANTRYRRALSERLSLHMGAAVEGKAYRLSESARHQAPELSASDLAYQAVQISVGATLRGARPANATGATLTLGKNFYGGAALADFAEIELSRTLAIGKRDKLRFTLAAEEQWRKDCDNCTSTSLTSQVDWRTRVGRSGVLQLSLSLRDTSSDSATIAHTAQIAAVDYRFTKPVFGAYLGLSAAYEARDYDHPVLSPEPRRDDKLSLGATVFLPEYDYYGFAPEIGLSIVNNHSSETLYETEDIGLTLGFRSAF